MPTQSVDARPAVWIGHAGPVEVPDLDRAVAFYESIGLHRIHGNDLMVALNLPGNALVGGGGGISLVAGFSRLFSLPKYILAVTIAVLPIPLMILVTGG